MPSGKYYQGNFFPDALLPGLELIGFAFHSLELIFKILKPDGEIVKIPISKSVINLDKNWRQTGKNGCGLNNLIWDK